MELLPVAVQDKDDRMATRIAFSTHFPARIKELAGKPTRFPEKIVAGLRFAPGSIIWDDYPISERTCFGLTPKTTTIRSNYEYWKSKEGQLIQPFFWSGKPYRSKQVVFCPEVRLAKVWYARITNRRSIVLANHYRGISRIFWTPEDFEYFTQHEGFDHPDHFWMWFDKDTDGAYLELESVKG